MEILCGSDTFTIEDKYIEYSPYLRTIKDTSLSVEKENGAIVLEDNPEVLQQYLLFLQGEDFEMNEEIAEFFDFMGHENNMCYPLDYWKIKLKDNWVRDNFYKYELWRDPYYKLIEIPIQNHIYLSKLKPIDEESLQGKPLYIAGGAALFMAGGIDKHDDIDIFTTDKDIAFKWVEKTAEFGHSIFTDVVSWQALSCNKTMQLILRVYKSPVETLYGFDLDCVGILYDGEKLWATERALYSLKNKVNWFDPSRASPSYVYRLAKYMKRGFQIRVPFLDEHINEDSLQSYWESVQSYMETKRGWSHVHGKVAPKPEVPRRIDQPMTYHEVIANNNVVKKYERFVNAIDRYNTRRIRHKIKISKGEFRFIRDTVSTLILAKYYGFFPMREKTSDYNSCAAEKEPVWKEQNPMEQLTSSFNPTPLGNAADLVDWFKRSPFAIGHNPSLYTHKDEEEPKEENSDDSDEDEESPRGAAIPTVFIVLDNDSDGDEISTDDEDSELHTVDKSDTSDFDI